MPKLHPVYPVCLLAALFLLLGGCGSGDPDEAPPPPDFAAALADAPPALADLYAQGDALLPGGVPAFRRQIEDLNGFPVVVNKWASWCGPCREEFPIFQEIAAEMGTEVAFLGVNGMDSDAAARTFLDSNPLPYPSFTDPDEDIVGEVLKADIGYPATVFFSRDGELIHTKFGPYPDAAALRDEIQRYALAANTGE